MAETLAAFFTYTAVGLTATFRDLSSGNPSSWAWDFGDNATSTEPSPTHTFTEEGFQTVTLTITKDAETSESSQRVGVSASGQECPQMPTYEAVMLRVPSSLTVAVAPPLVYSLIRKWQRIISKLVTPEIPEIYTHNELNWPILANELVVELVVLDLFEGRISNYLLSLMQSGSNAGSTTTTSGGGLKKVVTGPSEAEFYNASQSVSEQISSISGKGGLLEQSKNQACTLAGILRVPLQMCPKLSQVIFAPTIAKKS